MIKLNKSIKVVLFSLACIAFSANAQEGRAVIDGLIYERGHITGNTGDLPSHLVIPDSVTIDGEKYEVRMSYAELFANNTQLESVEIIGGDYIPVRAFFGCTNLKSVVFKGKKKRIGEAAFANRAIEKIDLTNISSCDRNCFKSCHSLTEVILPSDKALNVKFTDCPNIKKVTYDKNLYSTTTLRDFMFYGSAFAETLPAKARKANQAKPGDKRFHINKQSKTVTY